MSSGKVDRLLEGLHRHVVATVIGPALSYAVRHDQTQTNAHDASEAEHRAVEAAQNYVRARRSVQRSARWYRQWHVGCSGVGAHHLGAFILGVAAVFVAN